jgi:hypothetical protein
MAVQNVQMTNEQFLQLLNRINGEGQRNPRHFTQCTARFDDKRSNSAVEEFITAITIFKTVENIADADALAGLPLLLTGEANQWWNGVKTRAPTFNDAIQLIRSAFAPRRPNFRIFAEIFAHAQPENMATDQYVTIQRDRFSQMTRELDEVWQIDIVYGLVRKKIRDRVSRTDIETFEDLLEKARVIEANERDTRCSDKTVDETQKTRSRCSFCKIHGHQVSECRKKAKAENKRPDDTSAATTTQRPNGSSQNTVKCYGCGKEGVIRRNCPTCSPTTAPVSFCYLDVNGAERPAVKILIGGVPGTAYLDSGAKASLASPELYKVLKNQGHRFKEVPINLIQADGSSRPVVVQSTRASVLLNGREIPTNFMNIPGSPEAKTLLGVDFLKEAGLVIDYKNHRWHFSGKRHETYGFVHKDDNSRSSATPSDEEVTRICVTMSTLSPPISPFGSPLIIMECNYVHIASLDFQELHLQKVEATSLSPNERHQLDEVIINYAQLFEATGPPTPIVEHHIYTGTSSPVSSPPYRITPGRQKF